MGTTRRKLKLLAAPLYFEHPASHLVVRITTTDITTFFNGASTVRSFSDMQEAANSNHAATWSEEAEMFRRKGWVEV